LKPRGGGGLPGASQTTAPEASDSISLPAVMPSVKGASEPDRVWFQTMLPLRVARRSVPSGCREKVQGRE
jgi:hypothetical protein